MKDSAPEWLSLICQGESLEEVENWMSIAAEYGFRHVQPVFFWNGYSKTDFQIVSGLSERLSLNITAFGVYADLYKWTEPIGAIFKSTVNDLIKAIEHMHLMKTTKLVSWCGTSGDFAASCEQNKSEETRGRFFSNLRRLEPLLAERQVSLLFEPWRDHILFDEVQTAEACALNSECFQSVLDLPNFIAPQQWDKRNERIDTILKILNNHFSIVHLKDMLINSDGQVELPMFGRGELTGELTRAIQPWIGKVPVVAEHFSSKEDIPELIENVKRQFS